MDDRQLAEKLARMAAPEPSKEAQDQAFNAAMQAFDTQIAENTQGLAAPGRLTDIARKFNDVRRTIMQKRYVVSGAVGAVSLCALMAVLGGPFIQQQMTSIMGPGEQNMAMMQTGDVYRPDIDGGGEDAKILATDELSAIASNLSAPNADNGVLGDMPQSIEEMPTLESKVKTQIDEKQGREEMKSEAVARQSAIAPMRPKNAQPAEADFAPGIVAPVKKDGRLNKEGRRMAQDKMAVQKSHEGIGGSARNRAIAREAEAMPSLAAPVAPSTSFSKGRAQRNLKAQGASSLHMIAPVDVDTTRGSYQDVGRDKFTDFEENTVKSVSAEPVSTFSIDVDTASYSFMRRQLNNNVLPQKDSVRIEELVNYFDYDYATPDRGEDPFKPTVAVYPSPWTPGNKVVHIGIKGLEAEKDIPSNLVFLIDTSGSMNNANKLPLLVNSFKLLLDNLKPDDTIGIVVYAGSAGTVLEPTKVADKHKILAALDRLRAGGSTAGAEGIRQAYNLAESSMIKGGNNRILLATDGDFNVGITNPEELQDFVERKRDAGISLSVLGFGQGNYNDHIMQTLAQNGNGNASYIDSLKEAQKVLVNEAGSTLFTIAKDVKIQVEFNPAMVQEYRLLGYETRHLNREDFNNDKVDAGEVGSGATVTAIYEVTPVGVQPLVDDLRYGAGKKKMARPMPDDRLAAEDRAHGEYAFLKMRYKQPEGQVSSLITRPITPADERSFDRLPDDIRFASAVAGFGQLLKGSKFVGNLNWDQVIETANNAKGKDPFGYRAEFVQLVRLAKSAAGLAPLK